MRNVFVILILFVSLESISQDKIFHHFYEFSISGTKSINARGIYPNLGFGLNVNHGFRLRPKFHLIAGFEYNYSNQTTSYENIYMSNVDEFIETYANQYLSFSLLLRKSFGKKVRVFIELGATGDVYLNSIEKNTHNEYKNGVKILSEYEQRRERLTNGNSLRFSVGSVIPYRNSFFVVKVDVYKGIVVLNRGFGTPSPSLVNDFVRLTLGLNLTYPRKNVIEND